MSESNTGEMSFRGAYQGLARVIIRVMCRDHDKAR